MLLLHCPTVSSPPRCPLLPSHILVILVRIEAVSPLTPSGRAPRPSEPEAEAENGDAEGEISAESGDYAAQFQARFFGA